MYDQNKADAAVNFISNLTLVGDYSGEKWILEPFQEDIVRELFGKRKPDTTRQINKVSLWMPRGTAKTQLAAGLATYILLCGGPGQEIYAAAADKDKASRLFEAMAQMIRNDNHLYRLVDITDHYKRIKVKNKNSKLQVLAASEGQGNSLAPSALILDEIHLWRSRQFYSYLTSGFQKRKPGTRLEIQISTAGNSKNSLAWDLYSYAKNVRAGIIHDPNTLVRILEADPDDAWDDPATWRKCMPFSFVDMEVISEKCELAKHIKHEQNSFEQLYLGRWLEFSADKWIRSEEWEACLDNYTADDLIDSQEPVYLALDLSSVRDLTALSLWSPTTQRCLAWCWLPGDDLSIREEKDGVPYSVWNQDGEIDFTSGNRIVHSEVAEKVNDVLRKFNVVKFVADPRDIYLIAHHLTQEPEIYRQYPSFMAPPTKWLESAIASKSVKHNGNKLLSWCVSNVVVKDNIPSKEKSPKRIDPVAALIMAIGSWLGSQNDEPQIDINEFYKDRSNWQFD